MIGLYQIGGVTLDVRPLSADAVDRQAGADFAAHDLLGRRKGQEFVGEGDDTIDIRGTIITIRRELNGLPELEQLKGSMASGSPVYVMRGDGTVLGWYVINTIGENHEMLQPNGIGGVVKHSIKMTKVSDSNSSRNRQRFVDPGQAMITALVSLFA